MFSIQKVIKSVVCSLLDNSPINFEYRRKHFNTLAFCRNQFRATDLYKESLAEYEQILKTDIYKDYFEGIFDEYVEFMKQAYIHCNPQYSTLNQLIIINLAENLKRTVHFVLVGSSKLKDTDRKYKEAKERAQHMLKDVMVKTKYCINKEREEIYREIDKIARYYTFKRRFFSFIKFNLLYGLIILAGKLGFIALCIMCDGGDPLFYVVYPIKEYFNIF